MTMRWHFFKQKHAASSSANALEVHFSRSVNNVIIEGTIAPIDLEFYF